MENINTPEFYAERMDKLLAPLDDKRQEMKESLKEMRRMFSTLKAKIKKYEKIIAALDETNEKLSIIHLTNNAQMAINKFEGIEKRIDRCRQAINNFEKSYKELPRYSRYNDTDLGEMISGTNRIHYYFSGAIIEGENMLRIANKHLKKSDDHLAYHRRMQKGYRVR